MVCGSAMAQKRTDVYVDGNGVMRWGGTKEEVHGFGINYTAPFAHAYRSAKKLNVDLEKAIDDDVYHFARLGFDAFRVHVWDTEISDSVGNLLDNEHLKLFDYLLMRLKERGIKILITPIAFWGNGWPEPDEKTPGFSFKYGKEAALTNEDAIKAQENYLTQFVNHVNQYTKVAYKSDPDIVAFEVSNEPHHRGTPASVTTYINRMVRAIRKTGSKKPVFYNISHSVHLGDAYFNADIQGGTFQWYPTGLGAAHELRGNFLPNVDDYVIPFEADKRFKSIAKVVYEFDAADVGRSYIYPAMARSFREAGIQWATHFAYDPTYMAYANTEYNTHYMNLVYAPQKTLSLKIASEVFHRIPRYKDYGTYPQNATFESFSVNYEKDLAEMITDKKFIYTNNTETVPLKAEALEEIAGFGNSRVVQYEGKGAYFLDKIESGVWRLEVLPDAIWVNNLFGKNSLEKEVAVVNWRSWPIKINVADLGNDFNITALKGEDPNSKEGQQFSVRPGVYLLVRNGVSTNVKGSDSWKNIKLDEFVAPKTSLAKSYVIHSPYHQVVAGHPLKVEASVITQEIPDSVMLVASSPSGNKVINMNRTNAYDYTGDIPSELVTQGYLNYFICIKHKGTTQTFPSGVSSSPLQWDFYKDTPYKVPVVSAGKSLYLFNAITDSEEVSREWRKGSDLIPGDNPNTASLVFNVPQLFIKDPENLHALEIYDYSFRYNFSEKVKGRIDELNRFKKIVIQARSMDDKSFPLQVALVTRDGNAFGALITLENQASNEYTINIADLKPVKLVSLPRPYPGFLPYFFNIAIANKFLDLTKIESLQVSLGPGIEKDNLQSAFSFSVESVRLD